MGAELSTLGTPRGESGCSEQPATRFSASTRAYASPAATNEQDQDDVSLAPLEVVVGSSQISLKGEDAVFFMEEVTVDGESCSFIVVADGHGGKDASTYISTHMLARIVSTATGASATELDKAARSAFAQIHKEVCDKGTTSAGSTCTVCCINATRHEVSTWNVGDSLAMMVYDGGYRELGQTHRLEDSPLEQARVLKTGAQLGRVLGSNGLPGGPLRAYPGGLAVVRCIGDSDCMQFVTPTPAFSTCPAPPQGGAVIACSDGIWDHLKAEDAATCILSGGFEGGSEAARLLVETAVLRAPQKTATDDTSAAILIFGPKPSKSGNMDVAAQNPFVASFRNGKRSVGAHAHFDTKMPEAGPGAQPGSRTLVRENSNSWKLLSPNEHHGRPSEPRVPSRRVLSRDPFDGVSVKGGVLFADMTPRSGVRGDAESAKNDSHRSFSKKHVALHGAPPRSTTQQAPPNLTGDSDRDDDEDGSFDSMHSLLTSSSKDRKLSVDKFSVDSKGPQRSKSTPARKALKAVSHKAATPTPLRRRGLRLSGEYVGSLLYSSSKVTSKGGFASMFDSILLRPPVAFDGAHELSADIFMNSGSKRGTALPWQGEGVNDLYGLTNASADGQGWIPRRLPTPPPLEAGSARADNDLVEQHTRVHGYMTPARVIKWTDLGSLKFLGQGEFATAHATQLDNECVAVKMLKPEKARDDTAVIGLKRELTYLLTYLLTYCCD